MWNLDMTHSGSWAQIRIFVLLFDALYTRMFMSVVAASNRAHELGSKRAGNSMGQFHRRWSRSASRRMKTIKIRKKKKKKRITLIRNLRD